MIFIIDVVRCGRFVCLVVFVLNTLKMNILTIVWGTQHPNASRNIQYMTVPVIACLIFNFTYIKMKGPNKYNSFSQKWREALLINWCFSNAKLDLSNFPLVNFKIWEISISWLSKQKQGKTKEGVNCKQNISKIKGQISK